MGSITVKTTCICTVLAAAIAFIAGRATSVYLIGPPPSSVSDDAQGSPAVEPQTSSFLPAPQLIKGKEAPKSKYTSMIFSDVSSVSENYATLHLEVDDESPFAGMHNDGECVMTSDGHRKCLMDAFDEEDYKAAYELMNSAGQEEDNEGDGHDEEEEEHLPAGQHLLIDIERVNSEFLNSEVKLAEAMVNVVNESKLTLLSYHCHKLIPMGVSCVGVLLESHISFHTWPEAGIITLDLFTCGSGKLVPVLPILKNLFAVPQEGAGESKHEQPRMMWSHKMRGFREESDYLSKDLGSMILESQAYDMKKEVATAQTPFQRIDVYDILHQEGTELEDYDKSLIPDGSYQSRNPLLFEPDRVVFLDGVMQSSRNGNEAYHEALVHPSMFLHPDPNRVAIIGGGEGATLREVLKHDTIDEVKMIEIDEMMVEVSRKYLPDWNNCTDLVGSAAWCGDDKRADMNYVDAFAWFNDRFSEGSGEIDEEPFDVLIMDALDPEDDIPFAKMLYNDRAFVQTLYNSLSDDGVIVLQLGEAPDHDDPAAMHSRSNRREVLIELLGDVGFEAMHVYEEGQCGFEAPWTFLVAMKNDEINMRWYMNEAQVDIEIHDRIVRTKSGQSALKYFDGAVMQHYQYPHKVFETVYCRGNEQMCQKDVARLDIPLSAFEVRMSGVGDGSGRGIFTTVDIKQGNSIARAANTNPVHVPPLSLELIETYEDQSEGIEDMFAYIDGYGWESHVHGGKEYFVEPNFMTFANHGCNGTFNVLDWSYYQGLHDGEYDIVTEQNATRDDFVWPRDEVYNIFFDRHLFHDTLSYVVASRDIKAGEEILSDYLFYTSEPVEWMKELQVLKLICNGDDVGFITKQEAGAFNEA